MKTIATVVISLGSVCLYVALYYFWMFVRRRTEKENLFFSLVCVSIGCYMFACGGLYGAESVECGMQWQKFQFASIAMVTVYIVWFIYYLTQQKSKRPYWVVTAIMAVLFVAGLTVSGPLTVSIDTQMVKHIQIGDSFTVTYYESDPGPIYLAQYLAIVVTFLWILIVQIRYYRRVNKNIRPIWVSFVIFFISCVNDVLVGMAAYPFIYVAEYVYMIIVLSMAYVLLNKFVDLHNAIGELNATLEHKVDQRTAELKAAIDELGVKNLELEETRDQLWCEMQLAKKIQTALLPEKPAIEGLEIHAFMRTADDVGGDYYDVINVDGRNWLVIGDVSGHGVPAGLIMMMVQTSIHSVLAGNPDLSPTVLLERINNVITANVRRLNEDKYMTITVIACLKDGVFYFAGLHLDILIYRRATKGLEVRETNGMWIGLLDDIHDMVSDDNLRLGEGDVMLLYTDGITESWRKGSVRNRRNCEDDMYGDSRLKHVFLGLGDRSCREISDGIIASLGDYEQKDDITLVVVKKL
jgi:serine phosphatase RsbU (regulator of sigma subunit)